MQPIQGEEELKEEEEVEVNMAEEVEGEVEGEVQLERNKMSVMKPHGTLRTCPIRLSKSGRGTGGIILISTKYLEQASYRRPGI